MEAKAKQGPEIGAIEKGVPVAALRRGGGRKSQYPVADLKPRESFLVKCWMSERERIRSAITSAIGTLRKRHPERKFATRTLDAGVRCWRIR